MNHFVTDRRVPGLLLSLFVGASTVVSGEAFPFPDILKPNVAFWKRIYTEVSLTEGLLHDQAYPAVVYKKITVGNRVSRTRRSIIRRERNVVGAYLDIISTQPESTWSEEEKRIAKLIRKHIPSADRASASSRIRFQQGQKERFIAGLERSGAYLDTIRAVLNHYGLPARIAYLPHVESSFNTEAYSRVGAAGLWQFMRGTAKSYMTINYLVDERRDPFISTVAAARLLKRNYEVLRTWPLAITAYNHGLYGMKRAVQRCGSRDIAVIIQKHRSRSFRFASKNFYSCFLAASEIADDYASYVGPVKFHAPLKTAEVELSHYVRPSVLARYLGIEAAVLRNLNPALRPVVFIQDKQIPAGHRLRIPPDLSPDTAMLALAAIPDTLRSDAPERPRYYRVRRGDNLYGIASRLGVSARDIALENGITRMNRIYAGQVLRVPGATVTKVSMAKKDTAEPAEKKPEQVAVQIPKDTATVSKEPVKDSAAAAEKAPAEPPAPSEEIPDSLREVLMAPAVAAGAPPSREGPGVSPHFDVGVYNLEVVLSPTGRSAEIVVSVNETIGHYAEWLDIPTQRIRNHNNMGRRSGIRIGGRLSIPTDEAGLDRFVSARLEYHMALEEDFYSQFKVVDVRSREVEKGENLWDICNGEEALPLWLFRKYNKQLDLDKLMPGIEVWLPVIEEKTPEDVRRELREQTQRYRTFRQPPRMTEEPVRRTP